MLGGLQLDYIDLLYVHQPVGDFVGAWKDMEKAVAIPSSIQQRCMARLTIRTIMRNCWGRQTFTLNDSAAFHSIQKKSFSSAS